MRLATRHWPDPIDRSRRTILLLHGITGSHRTWWRIGPALAGAGWQVIAADLRCHGASGSAGPIGRWDLTDDVHETLGEVRVDVAWGHSLGARTVLQLLARHPDAAGRAILEDPPGVMGDRTEDIVNWRRQVALAQSDPAAFAAEVRADNPTWDERDVAGVVADVAACRIEPLLEALEAGVAMVDPSEQLAARLQVPTLLLLAAEDRSVLTGASRAAMIAALPPGSRTVELDGGHSLHRDLPDTYLRIATDWLA